MDAELHQKLQDVMERSRKALGLEDLADPDLVAWAKETDDEWVWFQIQLERHRRGMIPDKIRSRDGRFNILMRTYTC
jgi:hypothetical protein